MRRKTLMPSPPLLLPLAADAVTRPRQRPQPRKRNRTTADFTGAKGPRLEEEGPRPRSRSPDPSETAENPRLLLGLDRNRRALGGRSLGQGDRQQPILEGGADLAAVHRHGQADGAGKGP